MKISGNISKTLEIQSLDGAKLILHVDLQNCIFRDIFMGRKVTLQYG